MKNKAELLEMAVKALRLALKNAEAMGEHKNLPLPADVIITPANARALAEALEGMRWAAIYEGDERNEIGREYTKFEPADYVGRLAEGVDYLETVGIIRIKDDDQ